MAKELSKEELDERIAILKRFRKLLEQQRNKFQEYLMVLESQEGRIEMEDGDSIAAHAELENQIVKNLASLQKVIVPMQGMYNAIMPGVPVADNASVEQLQLDLANLQKQVLAQNERNRNLLQAQMGKIKAQLGNMNLMNPYRGRSSVYAEKAAVGSTIEYNV
ncbi:MAG: flagellar biosynthesis protein FlgN [Treponema sp.]|uniref:flagellar biosynthesis protein FlgN n=1 Tax=Treponema sp. TaxID=166 RepID=UPI0025CFCA6A|nr:flagellar biosynthesis protein FlgN [Treponema sp.]MBQ9624430.1 flagellar biosynthesis protein FlgN [Treponema sp.]MBR0496401.1 flagellar biosynthesis protein FlgN [Treponema sp.]